jgi:hypothetical protein
MAVSAESKKEEFQKYLEKNGVIDSLTKMLVGLYEAPEKPGNAIDFMKEYLGAAGADADKLRAEVEEQKKALEEKDRLIESLQKELAELKGGDAEAAADGAAEEAPAE